MVDDEIIAILRRALLCASCALSMATIAVLPIITHGAESKPGWLYASSNSALTVDVSIPPSPVISVPLPPPPPSRTPPATPTLPPSTPTPTEIVSPSDTPGDTPSDTPAPVVTPTGIPITSLPRPGGIGTTPTDTPHNDGLFGFLQFHKFDVNGDTESGQWYQRNRGLFWQACIGIVLLLGGAWLSYGYPRFFRDPQ